MPSNAGASGLGPGTPGAALREAIRTARSAAECAASVEELLRRPDVRAAINDTARPEHLIRVGM